MNYIDILTKLTSILATLGTIAVFSMDLGVGYNELEKKIYTNFIFQLAVIFGLAYQITSDLGLTIGISIGWVLLKFSSQYYLPSK